MCHDRYVENFKTPTSYGQITTHYPTRKVILMPGAIQMNIKLNCTSTKYKRVLGELEKWRK